jgi:hypothetical protein
MNDFGPGPATQGDVIQIGPDTSARRLTRCRGIVRLLVTTLFLALVASEGKAGIVASDARPPATRIITPLGSKTGQIYATYWTTRDGPYCATTAGDGPLIFGPRGVAFHPGPLLRIRILKLSPPTHVEVRAWRTIDSAGKPLGRGHTVPVRLSPHAVSGALKAWDVRFPSSRIPSRLPQPVWPVA